MASLRMLVPLAIGALLLATPAAAQNVLDVGADALNAMNFDTLLSSPLTGVIKAQAEAAMTTVDFVTEVGFVPEGGDPDGGFATTGTSNAARGSKGGTVRTVQFGYTSADDDGGVSRGEIEVPFLTMVPIPYLQIDEVDVDLSVEVQQTASTTVVESSRRDRSTCTGFFCVTRTPKKVKAAVKFQEPSVAQTNVTGKYNMDVRVRASQAPMPKGAEMVLSHLLQMSTVKPRPNN